MVAVGCTTLKAGDDHEVDAGTGPPPLTGPCDANKPFGPKSALALPFRRTAGLRLSPDQRTGYFEAPGPNGDYALYMGSRVSPDAAFDTFVPVPSLNTPAGSADFDPTLRADGLWLIYARSSMNWQAFGLRWATRPERSNSFADMGSLSVDSVDGTNDTTPFLRSDGQVLYFASDRAPGESYDLYRATWNGGAYAPATPIKELNSLWIDWEPVISADELTIYFASYRPAARGGASDIYAATRGSTAEPFSAPTFLETLNTADNEAPTYLTPDGCTLYFFSDHGTEQQMFYATKVP